jgi:hypothetical protein
MNTLTIDSRVSLSLDHVLDLLASSLDCLSLDLLASSLDCLRLGYVSLALVPALVLAPDDIGVPYPTGVDSAGLAILSNCWNTPRRYARAVRLSEHSDCDRTPEHSFRFSIMIVDRRPSLAALIVLRGGIDLLLK